MIQCQCGHVAVTVFTNGDICIPMCTKCAAVVGEIKMLAPQIEELSLDNASLLIFSSKNVEVKHGDLIGTWKGTVVVDAESYGEFLERPQFHIDLDNGSMTLWLSIDEVDAIYVKEGYNQIYIKSMQKDEDE